MSRRKQDAGLVGTWGMGAALLTAPSGPCHPRVTTARLPPRPGFADPGKSIAAVCRWPARGEGLGRGEDGEGAGGPQGRGERQQNHVAGEGLDGGDPEGICLPPWGVRRIPPEDAAPSSSRSGEPRLLPEPHGTRGDSA